MSDSDFHRHLVHEESSDGSLGVLAFDNDTANDWAYALEETDDLSLVESTLSQVLDAEGENDEDDEDDYLDADLASEALAACEVLARLLGRPGHQNAYTEKVDAWVAARRDRISPSEQLLSLANQAIDRVLGENSELRELWDEAEGDEWRAAVNDLRQRLRD